MDPTLVNLADTVSASRSMEDLARPLLEMLETASGFECVYLTTLDADSGLLHILFSRNSGALQIPEGLAVPWQDTLCRRAMESEVFQTSDVPTLWPDSEAARDLGIRSYVSTPVKSGQQLFGTLCAVSAESRALEQDGERLLHMFARLIGQQVEREALLAQLQRANIELNSVALTDPLTGLANRRALLAELVRMLARSQRDGTCVHVAFLDLDGFKAINDRHGHDVGDAFLAVVATRLASVLRSGDLAARYGGDEFVVLAPAVDGGGAQLLARRLFEATRGHYVLGEIAFDYPGASIGIATHQAGEGAHAVLARADEIMYANKRERRR